jgi:hypothetical protein
MDRYGLVLIWDFWDFRYLFGTYLFILVFFGTYYSIYPPYIYINTES